ncbi:hypothetical protein Zmor_019363 [Zophobas morio]|uniref:Ionotropic receptor n=1 Tax=Zophobas morio TaxID=2755281 RepID=A0AA38I3C6_9CUCU|nr:hypothetical protein Zmor_019363 [Zophobas morio]
MLRILFVLSVFFFDQSSACVVPGEELLTLLQAHFRFVNFLTINVIQSGSCTQQIHNTANTLIKLLLKGQFEWTLQIQEIFLPPCFTHDTQQDVSFDASTNSQITVTEDILKLKKYSTEPGNGYLFIIWSPEKFEEFLDHHTSLAVPKSRCTYSILFVISSANTCGTIRKQIEHLMRRLWADFNLVNIIIQAPCSCQDATFIYRPFVKTRDSWGTLQSYTFQQITQNPTLLVTSLRNLNHFPVRVSLFEKLPTALQAVPNMLKFNPIYQDLSVSKEFAGSDGLLVGTLVQYLNFEAVVDPDLPRLYGHVLQNGSVIGVLALVLNGKSDYGANRRILSYYPVDGFEFTVAYSSDKISAVVPKSLKVPRGLSIFNCFDKLSWVLIFVVSFVCVFFWYLISRDNLYNTLKEIYSLLVGMSVQIVPSSYQTFFLTSCMIFNLIIFGVIQGSLFTDFTTPSYYPEINTVEEVDKSQLPIMTYVWLLIKDNSSQLLNRLKVKSIPESANMYEIVALYKNVVSIDRKFDVEVAIRTQFTGDDGVPLLHMVKEDIATFLLSCIVPKGSPYLLMFNNVITSMFEGGFIKKWDNDVVESIMVERINRMISAKKFKAFSLDDIQAAFYITGVGYVCSVVAFVGEIMKNKFREQQF